MAQLTEHQLISLANHIDTLVPEVSAQSVADSCDIVISGRRHNGVPPGDALASLARIIERYGLRWGGRRRGWVRS